MKHIGGNFAIRTISNTVEEWAQTMGHLTDAPKKLSIRGAGLPQPPALAVVGPRKHSVYAEQVTRLLIPPLARAGIHIVSGLAFGIDTLAHTLTIDVGGLTTAVVCSGLDDSHIYPRSNLRLAHSILKHNGSLISEMPAQYKPFPYDFPKRNRIVAALSNAVLLVEGAHTSGALITARLALELGKDVFVIPQNITSPQASGVNHMLRDGAIVCTEPEDILRYFGIQTAMHTLLLHPEQQVIFELIQQGHTIDDIVKKAKQPYEKVISELSMLELNGVIKRTQHGFSVRQ